MNRKNTFIIAVGTLIIMYAVFTGNADISLLKHIAMSFGRMAAGYVLAVAIGMLTALLLGSVRVLRIAFKPILSFFISIPTITWVPLLLVLTGISEKTIIITIFLGSYFAVVYNTLDGFDNVDRDLVKVGMMLEYGPLRRIFLIFIPASLNNIIVGLKLGIAYSWRALVGAEMLGATSFGLGYKVFAARRFYDINGLLLSLMLIGFIGYLMNRALKYWVEERTVLKWGGRQ